MSLEEIGIATNWRAEHVLKRISYKPGSEPTVPDALFSATSSNQSRVVALELELNGKSQSRYERILGKYLEMKTLWAVWYLVPSPSLGETLIRSWRKLTRDRRNDRLMWSLVSEVLNDPSSARIRSQYFNFRMDELFTLRALAPALPQSKVGDGLGPNSKSATAETKRNCPHPRRQDGETLHR
jgi:hypothetical protein